MDIYNDLFAGNSFCFNIFNEITDEIAVYDCNGIMQYCNHATEQSEGYKLKDAKGKSIFELYDFENEVDRNTSPTLYVLKNKCSIRNVPYSYYINGQRKTKSISVAPIFKDGDFFAVYVIQRDMTQLANMVDQNIALQYIISQQKSHFVSLNDNPFDELVGETESFLHCVSLAKQAAQTNSSIMLIGNEGCGKKTFARAIHDSSNRVDKPYLTVNCASIPEALFESLLFGTCKNAYTGALEKDGILVQADGGTVFFDEINYMPIMLQAKLLQVLEDRQVCKLGSNIKTPIDIRIICSSNASLSDIVQHKQLRMDFLYYISVVQIQIPPLIKRKRDIPLLADCFLNKFNNSFRKKVYGISPDAMDLLSGYHWPGNVRQLKSCIETTMNFVNDGSQIMPSDLPAYILRSYHEETHNGVHLFENEINSDVPERKMENSSVSAHVFSQKKVYQDTQEKEKEDIIAALKANGGNITQTANSLGISRQLLYYRLKKYHLE